MSCLKTYISILYCCNCWYNYECIFVIAPWGTLIGIKILYCIVLYWIIRVRLLILSNEEKTNDYENFKKGMIYMKILKKGGVVEKRGEEETKSMPHAPVSSFTPDVVITVYAFTVPSYLLWLIILAYNFACPKPVLVQILQICPTSF